MTPEQQKKIWGRKVKGPQHGRWVEDGRPGNLVWKRWPRRRKENLPTPAVADTKQLEPA